MRTAIRRQKLNKEGKKGIDKLRLIVSFCMALVVSYFASFLMITFITDFAFVEEEGVGHIEFLIIFVSFTLLGTRHIYKKDAIHFIDN